VVHGSPAIVGRQLLIRGDHGLYCIAEPVESRAKAIASVSKVSRSIAGVWRRRLVARAAWRPGYLYGREPLMGNEHVVRKTSSGSSAKITIQHSNNFQQF
jgi:hypothetical protein